MPYRNALEAWEDHERLRMGMRVSSRTPKFFGQEELPPCLLPPIQTVFSPWRSAAASSLLVCFREAVCGHSPAAVPNPRPRSFFLL